VSFIAQSLSKILRCGLDRQSCPEVHREFMKNICQTSVRQVRSRAIVAVLTGCLPLIVLLASISVSFTSQAQGLSLGGAQNISPQDLNTLKSSMGMGGLGLSGSSGAGANFFGPSMGGATLLALPPVINNEEQVDPNKKDTNRKAAPLPPNEFQKYVLEVTGKALPLYGADFFENSRYAMQQQQSPVGDDYVLGAGDQLLIRVWGSTSGETQATIDRAGEIAIPKLGTLRLAGVKASQAQASVKALFNKFYKDIEVSVSLGKLRKITVFVVGQSRYPGSYQLNSQATLTSGLFASGGPNASGSIRKVQLKRNGAVVSELDLYAFLGKGDKTSDVRLQDGDVIFYQQAAGHMAFVGKVNAPGVFEIKNSQETVADFLNLAGGLPVVADPRRANIERLTPGKDQPRRIEVLTLDEAGLKKQIQNGDVVNVGQIVPEMANAITLRGNVAQISRTAFKPGMRISDVISQKTLLMSPESVRKQNEVLFDTFEQERSARFRGRVPLDLALERMSESQDKSQDKSKDKSQDTSKDKSSSNIFAAMEPVSAARSEKLDKSPFMSEETLVDRIGGLVEDVNLDYAVIERINRSDLKVNVIPFNLGKVLANPKDPENLELQAGDVITVLSVKDLRVPISRRQIFVRIEGEVNKPGVYQVAPSEGLKQLIEKAGGMTADAYLFGAGFYREEVKKNQQENLGKLLRRIESESAGSLAQAAQSMGASSDFGIVQAKIATLQQLQKQTIERAKSLKPEGRISLGLNAESIESLEKLPQIRLNQGDKFYIPPRPDFVYIFGSVNTESALVYRPGLTVADYIQLAGSGAGANTSGVILMRADGSALTNQSSWRNEVLYSKVMPGDTIVMPEKLDRESGWSVLLRNTKDFTQILYQLGLGAAAIKTLRQ
jgi:protein involved in polysaccharide export with SLBB domain